MFPLSSKALASRLIELELELLELLSANAPAHIIIIIAMTA